MSKQVTYQNQGLLIYKDYYAFGIGFWLDDFIAY